MEPTFIILAAVAAIAAGSSIMLNKKLKKAISERDHAIAIGTTMAQRVAVLQASKFLLEEGVLSGDSIHLEKCKYKIETDRAELNAMNNIFEQ